MLLQPNKKSTKRLREVLSQLYIHLDNSALQSAHDVRIYYTFLFLTFKIQYRNFRVFYIECRHSRLSFWSVGILPVRVLQT